MAFSFSNLHQLHSPFILSVSLYALQVGGKQSTMNKSKLNELCHKNSWLTPKYSCERDGKDHSPLFKASVVVNGTTFASETLFKSSKSAHNDAAALALSHFTGELSKKSKLEEDKAMATTPPPSQTTVATDGSDRKKCTGSSLLCNKVRVYTSIPTMVLPKGSVILPIGEDKWTVVSLE